MKSISIDQYFINSSNGQSLFQEDDLDLNNPLTTLTSSREYTDDCMMNYSKNQYNNFDYNYCHLKQETLIPIQNESVDNPDQNKKENDNQICQNNNYDISQDNNDSQEKTKMVTKFRKKRSPVSKQQRKLIKGMIIALNHMEYDQDYIYLTISELGYKITKTHVNRVIKKYKSTQNILGDYGVCGRDRILKDEEVKDVISKIYHGDVSLKEAAQDVHVSRHTLSRYLQDYGLGVSQYNSKVPFSQQIQMRKKISMEVNYEKIDIKNQNDYVLQNSKERIMFPKIQFGQVHQWDRFYNKFYQEVKIFNITWLGFYKGNKMNGRGCFIVIKCILDYPYFFSSINSLENFLRKFIPENYFSSNVMPTNKLRVYTTYKEALNAIDPSQEFNTFENVQIRRRVRKCKPYTQQEQEFIKNFNILKDLDQDNKIQINNQQDSQTNELMELEEIEEQQV